MMGKRLALAVALFAGAAVTNAAELPACGTKQVGNMVVDEMNRIIREHPLARSIANGLRIVSIESAAELYHDASLRACSGNIKRSNGETGEIGYTVEWYSRNNGTFIVQTYDIDQLKAQYAKPLTPTSTLRQKGPSTAKGSDDILPAAHWACIESAASIQAMTDCALKQAKIERARADAAYGSAYSVAADPGKFAVEQDAWRKSMAAYCEKIGKGKGADAEYAGLDCLAHELAKRATVLEAKK